MRAWQAGGPEEIATALRAEAGDEGGWPTAAAVEESARRVEIPIEILRLADAVGSELTAEAAETWPERFTRAIAKGADLRTAFAAWAGAVLTKLAAASPDKTRDRALIAERYRNRAEGLEDDTADWEASFTVLFEHGGDQLAMHACRPASNAGLAAESMVATVATEGGPIEVLAATLVETLGRYKSDGSTAREDDGATEREPGTYRATVYQVPNGTRLGGERHINATSALEAAVLAAAAAGAPNCTVRTSRADDDGDPHETRIRTSARRLRTLARDGTRNPVAHEKQMRR